MNAIDRTRPRKCGHYRSTALNSVFDIRTIFTIHYFEYDCGFVYKGEKHDFWEMLYVDSGSVEVIAGERQLILEKGHVIFHQPNEFHAFRAIGKKAPNLIVISFDCECPYIDAFREQVISTTESQVRLFGILVEYAKQIFCLPLVNPLRLRGDAPFGAEQIFKSTLERLLIELYQSLNENPSVPAAAPISGNHEHLMEQVMIYLQERLTQKLTVADICRENMISRSLLQRIFHEYKGCGVIECFNRLKIEAAMEMIRENRYTYSQIATILNYSSYQYFSLQFRKYVRMSPSEYHISAKHFHR